MHLFLSDVETSTWSQQDLNRVVSSAARVIITEGEKGATLLAAAQDSSVDSKSRNSDSKRITSGSAFQEGKIPAVKVRTGLAALADQWWQLLADHNVCGRAWRCRKAAHRHTANCFCLLLSLNHPCYLSPAPL